jgi:heptosyltransferase-2
MKPRRILVRAPNWVGDAVMATPALRALREAHPGAHITVEGRPALAGLLRGLPTIDEFLPDEARDANASFARARALRSRRFDWGVLLSDSPRAALAPFVARVPRRIGYARDPLRRALLTDSLTPPRRGRRRVPIPMVERYLKITRHMGCPDRGTHVELVVDPATAGQVEEKLAQRGVSPADRVLLVAPGASFGASKLWPPEHFAGACDGIARRLKLLPVLAPAPSEISIARAIEESICERVVSLVDPPLELEELKALVQRSELVLSNDTGPRQIAIALGRPVVVAMGPTDPRHTAHQLERQRVLREQVPCGPCHYKTCPIDHRCMTRLQPAQAIAAAEELLA